VRAGTFDMKTLGKLASAVKVPKGASVKTIASKVQKLGEKLALAVAGAAGVPAPLAKAALRVSTAIQTAPIRAARAVGRKLKRR
jgi:hypothetical protein